MRFILEFTDSAVEDLGFFKKYEQALILDQMDTHLRYEPTTETRNRKPLEPNPLAEWELRIGSYRVFYDTDTVETKVKVKAIGYKEHSTLYIRRKEYTL